MQRHKCTICKYVYNPEQGDPEGGIAPGTPFEEIPEKWSCPLCGAGTIEFERAA